MLGGYIKMTAIRQDAWSQDDDLLLAEVTLRHIREGSTQLSAFEEVGERIGRTSAACGFRWNSFVRKQNEEAIQIAKQQRHKRSYLKKQTASLPQVSSVQVYEAEDTLTRLEQKSIEESLSIDTVIRFLREWKGTYQDLTRQIKQYERAIKDKDEELQRLRHDNDRLLKEVSSVQLDYRAVNDDYKTLIQIMDRARRLTVLSAEDEMKPRFKMDANGDLERIE